MSEPGVSEMVLGLIARFRVTIGFTCAVFVLWLAEPTGASLAVGTSIAVLGELLRIWGAGHLNKSREVTMSKVLIVAWACFSPDFCTAGSPPAFGSTPGR